MLTRETENGSKTMRYLIWVFLCTLAALAPRASAQEPIFAAGAKLKVEAEGGVGGEGPAWHSKLGLLTSGNGHINQLDRTGKSRVYRKGAAPMACSSMPRAGYWPASPSS